MRKCLFRIKGNNIKFDRAIEKSIFTNQNGASLNNIPPVHLMEQ